MARQDLQWIELTDFSPGIWSNNNLAGGLNITSPNLAYAQETNTYRCHALPTGGLGPLPRRKEDFILSDPPDSPNEYRVSGFSTWGQVFDDPQSGTDFDHRVEIHLALTYNNADPEEVYGWYRDRIYDTAPSTETILTRTFSDSEQTHRFASMFKTRMRTADPLEPGQPVMVLLWSRNPLGVHNDNRISRAHPDPDTADTNATAVIGNETESFGPGVGHQGRVVLARFLSYDRGADTILSTNDNLEWTNVNLNTLSSSDPAIFVPEWDQSLTDMASMTANQLLVIKSVGGGYTLNGDLDDVTVVQLPNLMCSDGSDTVRGVNTPIGFIYSAGNAGLYVWNGGDAAQPISAQLDGNVFTRNVTIQGNNGQMDRWQDLVLAPQNWVLDLNTKGWWRIEDPDDALYIFWSTSKYLSQTYGAVRQFDDDEFAYSLFEKEDLAYSYSWQSHPLWATQARLISVRQGLAAIQGTGQVTFTVFDVTDSTNNSTQTIDVDTDVIQNYRFDISVAAENLAIRIEAAGGVNANAEAPLVHRVYLGWDTATQLANANAQ